jgi:copper transport protein
VRLGKVLALAAALAVVAGFARPPVAWAHALLRSSEPAAGSTLGSAPAAVTLAFSEKPDLRLTSVKVLDSGGRDHVTGAIEASGNPPDSVRISIGELGDGVYTVTWRTVSAVDGHISAGTFSFGVGVAPPTGPPGVDPGGTGQTGSPAAIVARWLLYLGLVGLLGAAFVAVAVARRQVPDLLSVAAAGWVLAALGTVGVVAVQWIEAGAPLETILSTSIGLAALARAASLLLVGAALVALAAGSRVGPFATWLLVGLTAAAALGVDVMTGHAAAGPAWLPQVVVQWLHGVAAAVWVGGLASLLVMLRTTPAGERLSTARRFSSWAGVGLVGVALTGLVRAVTELGTLDAILGSDFGRVLVLKSALLAALAGLGAVNRFVTLRDALRDAARIAWRLRRIGGGEVALAVAVLGLSALLVNLTPPASAGAPPAAVAPPIVATGHDFGTSVRVRLVATPGAPGPNDFDVAVVDYDTAEPVAASRLELRFELVSEAKVEPSSLELEPSAPGRFRGTGSNLSIDGIWRVTATVATPDGGVEVPLLLATTVPPRAVDRIVSPGLPTIFVVQLGEVGSAQVYLDPGKPGSNELHVTFFDPAGAELPVDGVTIATRSIVGGDAPAPRRLGPGHFVASTDAIAGPLDVDVVTPPLDRAGLIHLHVTIEVEP